MTTKPLLDFIMNQVSLGVSRDAIEKMLFSQGWTEADVKEAFDTLYPQSSPRPVTKSVPNNVPPVITYEMQRQSAPIDVGSMNTAPRKTGAIFTTTLVIIVVLAGVAYGYTKLAPMLIGERAEEILQNGITATLGSLSSFDFIATTTAKMRTTVAKSPIPQTADIALNTSGSVDLHDKNHRLVSLNIKSNSTTNTNTDTGELLLALKIIYASDRLFLNLENFSVTYKTSDKEKAQSQALVAMANGLVASLENRWIDMGTSTKGQASSISSETLTAEETTEIVNYIRGQSYVESVENIGTETLSNVATHHIQLKAKDDGQLLAMIKTIYLNHAAKNQKIDTDQALSDLSDLLAQELTVDFWIGKEDKLIYAISFSPVTINLSQTGMRYTVQQDITLSGFGTPKTITAPADATSFQQIMSELFGGLFSAPVKTTTSTKK